MTRNLNSLLRRRSIAAKWVKPRVPARGAFNNLSRETQKLLEEKMVLAFLAGLKFARTPRALMTDEGFIIKGERP